MIGKIVLEKFLITKLKHHLRYEELFRSVFKGVYI